MSDKPIFADVGKAYADAVRIGQLARRNAEVDCVAALIEQYVRAPVPKDWYRDAARAVIGYFGATK